MFFSQLLITFFSSRSHFSFSLFSLSLLSCRKAINRYTMYMICMERSELNEENKKLIIFIVIIIIIMIYFLKLKFFFRENGCNHCYLDFGTREIEREREKKTRIEPNRDKKKYKATENWKIKIQSQSSSFL